MDNENGQQNDVEVYRDVTVAGVTFEGRQTFVRRLTPTSVIQLEADPANPYDPNAIKVIADGNHVGFVPRELAAVLNEGATYTGVITRLTRGRRASGIRLDIRAERRREELTDGPQPTS